MKRKVICLSAAGITFIIGVASVMIWFQFPNLRGSYQQSPAEPKSFRGSERTHVCLKRFDINLGDSFDYVNSVINLMPNPNGPNENISWHKGKLTDFFTVSQPSLEIDKENRLNPAIFCTFDDQKRLKSFFISWRIEGKQINSIKRKIIDTIVEKEHPCMRGKRFDKPLEVHTDYLDFGDYWGAFAYDFRENSNWSVGYVIETKDVLYGAPNNSFNRSANSIDFIENLSVMILNARPVNSSVRRLLRATE